ncbi:MAG: histidinol-phosphate transaminase [Planctomycetota bacterium]|nr:histidinol-phosphate transaminase [Planctomycetota bacterium]
MSRINEHTRQLTPKPPVAPRPVDAISLDRGEQPYPPSPLVIEAIRQSAANSHKYPDPNGWELRQTIARYAGCRPENVVLGNGSDELIELVVKTHACAGDEIIVPVPSFFVYGFAAQMLNVRTTNVPRADDYSLAVDPVLAAIRGDSKVVYVANPNNPTGTLTSRESLVELLEGCECAVVVDECYFEFSQQTVADLIDRFANLIVLRSFSKGFGLAGLRIGYAITNEDTAEAMFRSANLFSTNRIAQAAALAALSDVEYTRTQISRILDGRRWLSRELTDRGVLVLPSETNFLFASMRSLEITSADVVAGLKLLGVYIADFGNKPGTDEFGVRIAVGSEAENTALVERLDRVIAESRHRPAVATES